MNKKIATTVLFVVVLLLAGNAYAGLCEQALAMCTNFADWWYWDCMTRNEESQCRYVYDDMIARCFAECWDCLYG